MTDHAREAAEKLWKMSDRGHSWPGIVFVIPVIQAAIDAAVAEAVKAAGKRGGKARAAKLSKERRREIAQHAAETRWSQAKESSKP